MSSRFHVTHEISVAIIFSYHKKNETTKIMTTANFMCNMKSARYFTIYFSKAVKYDETQQKRIRGLLKYIFRDTTLDFTRVKPIGLYITFICI
jgi:hypothetical protein